MAVRVVNSLCMYVYGQIISSVKRYIGRIHRWTRIFVKEEKGVLTNRLLRLPSVHGLNNYIDDNAMQW
jgi:hypothetical protein